MFEKKTAKFLLYPKKRRIIIMEPDLLTPGINAKHWKKPTNKEVNKSNSLLPLTVRQNLSKIKRIIPNKMLVIPTIRNRLLLS